MLHTVRFSLVGRVIRFTPDQQNKRKRNYLLFGYRINWLQCCSGQDYHLADAER